MRFLSHKMRRVGNAPEPVTGISAGVLPALVQSMTGTHVVSPGTPEWTLSGTEGFADSFFNGSALAFSNTDPSAGYVAGGSSTFQAYDYDAPSAPDIDDVTQLDNRTFTSSLSVYIQGGFWTAGGGNYFVLDGFPFGTRTLKRFIRDPGEPAYEFQAYTMAGTADQSVDLSTLFSADRVGGVDIHEDGLLGVVGCTVGGVTTMRRFSMTTPFDLSTIAEDSGQVGTLADISLSSDDESREYQPICTRIDPTGLALFVMAQYNDGSDYIAIREYTMATAMDVANLTYSGREVDVSSLPISGNCLCFDFTRGVASGASLVVTSTNRLHQASIT